MQIAKKYLRGEITVNYQFMCNIVPKLTIFSQKRI